MRYADAKCNCEKRNIEEYVFTGPCCVTGKPYSVTVKAEELHAYRRGTAPIQDAMPSLSADDREFLISGCTPEGWEIMFGTPTNTLLNENGIKILKARERK